MIVFGREYPSSYDAIVIGSGVGGLVCANLLAEAGLKILLIEQHYMLGGYCSTFFRKGFTFDAATHFYPLLGNPETLTGKLLKKLGLPTRWIKMDPVDKFHFPGESFIVPSDFSTYLTKLKERFPHQLSQIDQFFSEVREAYLYGLLYYFREIANSRAEKYRHVTLEQKLREHFQDPKLRAFLMADHSHWGSLPSQTSFLFDSMLRLAYFLGNYYPRGSSQAFANDLGDKLKEQGGHVLLYSQVRRVLIENGRAYGVVVQTRSRRNPQRIEFRAPVVVSNGDIVHTYRDLIGEENCGRAVIDQLLSLRPSYPCFLVHIGLRGISHQRLEAVHGYQWKSWDQNDLTRTFFKLFFPTLYDQSIAPPGHDILIIQKLSAIEYDKVTDWQAHKTMVEAEIMSRLREILPEVDEHTVIKLSASALTSHRFTLNYQGAMLGWEMSPDQLGTERPANETPIRNLYLTGHWTRPGGGITPVIVSAQRVAGQILSGSEGLREPKLPLEAPRQSRSLAR